MGHRRWMLSVAEALRRQARQLPGGVGLSFGGFTGVARLGPDLDPDPNSLRIARITARSK